MSQFASRTLVVLVALGAAGCGTTPDGPGPALTTQLGAVDAAAVADDPKQVKSAVAGLLREVDSAESAGDLSAAHADRIRGAAEALLDAAAPAEQRPPKESTTTPPPPPDEDQHDSDEDDDD